MQNFTEQDVFQQKKNQRSRKGKHGFEFRTKSTIKCCEYCSSSHHKDNCAYIRYTSAEIPKVLYSLNKDKRWEIYRNLKDFKKNETKENLIELEDDLKGKVLVGNQRSCRKSNENIDFLIYLPESDKLKTNKCYLTTHYILPPLILKTLF